MQLSQKNACFDVNNPFYEYTMKSITNLLILGLLVIKLCFLPQEYTGDSYGYACEILKGDLISGHHLLHKYLIFGVWNGLKLFQFNPDVLVIGVYLNSIFSAFSLLILNQILMSCCPTQNSTKEYRNATEVYRFNWILFVASSFVFIRYSTENETYIFPIFFTLLGWFFQLRNQSLSSILFYTLSVGFHQTYLLICIPLILDPVPKNSTYYSPISNKFIHLHKYISIKKTHFLHLFLFFLLVFGGYYFAAKIYNRPFQNVFFQDVQAGLVQTVPNWKNLLFGFINTIRVFIQIHGEIQYQLLNTWPIWVGIVLIFLLFIWNNPYINYHINLPLRKSIPISGPLFSLIVTWLFALYSVGNLEFMAIIPFFIAIICFKCNPLEIQHSPFKINGLPLMLLIWNLTVYTLPHSLYSTQNLAAVNKQCNEITVDCNSVNKNFTQPVTHYFTCPYKGYFISDNAALFENYAEYQFLKRTSRTQILSKIQSKQKSNQNQQIKYDQRFFHNTEELISFLKKQSLPPKQNVQYIIISDDRSIQRSNLQKYIHKKNDEPNSKNQSMESLKPKSTPSHSVSVDVKSAEKPSPENKKQLEKSWVTYLFSEPMELNYQFK